MSEFLHQHCPNHQGFLLDPFCRAQLAESTAGGAKLQPVLEPSALAASHVPMLSGSFVFLGALGSGPQTMSEFLHQHCPNHQGFLLDPFCRAQLAESTAGGRGQSCSVPGVALRLPFLFAIWHSASGRSVA
eukprot:CAMPEP_0172790992 /NCGR_PEP_ID=MMETSP1074-20121228/208245_1 /TAXON_ID=2916 /ORGANISM="Ceratium fusus, Strain PA161109" /LENGTH=130 /DNA_ID=CAMNT_0013628047 /DNA_START=354 /DNA_END=746 /DNA_ORIENTATION=-